MTNPDMLTNDDARYVNALRSIVEMKRQVGSEEIALELIDRMVAELLRLEELCGTLARPAEPRVADAAQQGVAMKVARLAAEMAEFQEKRHADPEYATQEPLGLFKRFHESVAEFRKAVPDAGAAP